MNRVNFLPLYIIGGLLLVVIVLVFAQCDSGKTDTEAAVKFRPAKGDIDLGHEPTPTPSPTPQEIRIQSIPTPTPTPMHVCDDACMEYKRRLGSDIEVRRDWDQTTLEIPQLGAPQWDNSRR